MFYATLCGETTNGTLPLLNLLDLLTLQNIFTLRFLQFSHQGPVVRKPINLIQD